MPDENDVWNTTFYHRAIRTKIGEALSADYDLSTPLPDRVRTLREKLGNQPCRTSWGSEHRRDEPPGGPTRHALLSLRHPS